MICRSPDFNICVVTPDGLAHRVAKITFTPDGCIYFMFPEIKGLPGVLASGKFPAIPGKQQEIELGEIGRSTSHLVKFSYHPNGRAHFSQDGKVLTQIICQAEPLDTRIGHIFSAKFQHIWHMGPPRNADKTPKAGLLIGGPGKSVTFVVWRYRTEWLASRITSTPELGALLTNDDKTVQPGILVSAPDDFTHSDFALMLAVEEGDDFAHDADLAFAFIGGFAPLSCDDNGRGYRSVLLGIYPATDTMASGAKIPSIDYIRPS